MAKESVAQNNIWKWLVFAAVTVGAVWLAYPPREKIRLGLDLKGGNSFTLGVDYARLHDKIIESKPELANDPEALEAEVKRTLESKDFDDRMIEICKLFILMKLQEENRDKDYDLLYFFNDGKQHVQVLAVEGYPDDEYSDVWRLVFQNYSFEE